MAGDEQIPERDILLLYISDQFKELFGMEKPKKAGGVPLDPVFVDRLLKNIQAKGTAGSTHKLLFDQLKSVWGTRKSDEELHALITAHTARMKLVVRNAEKIARDARVRCDRSSADDMQNIQLIDAKKEILRGYLT